MTGGEAPPALFSEIAIRAHVAAIAKKIARLDDPPDLAIPILVGGFVFAADLLRDLNREGISLAIEFLRLRSYAYRRTAEDEIAVLLVPGEPVTGRHVLLIDGVLDHGRTLHKARELVFAAGARAATTAVVVDKRRDDALLRADFAAFTSVAEFIVVTEWMMRAGSARCRTSQPRHLCTKSRAQFVQIETRIRAETRSHRVEPPRRQERQESSTDLHQFGLLAGSCDCAPSRAISFLDVP